jgi:hypothetical protein
MIARLGCAFPVSRNDKMTGGAVCGKGEIGLGQTSSLAPTPQENAERKMMPCHCDRLPPALFEGMTFEVNFSAQSTTIQGSHWHRGRRFR